MSTAGERIKNLREKNGLTQQQLAKMIGKSQGTIAHIEKDEHKGNFEILEKMCTLFHVSADYILFGKEATNDTELNEEGKKLLQEYKEYLKEKYPKEEYKQVENL